MKHDIAQATKEIMDEWYPDSTAGHRCLYWAHAGMAAFARAGVRAGFMAGTAFFKCNDRRPPESNTFGMFWRDAPDAVPIQTAEQKEGTIAMPEIHIWIWLIDTKEVVDFSVGELPIMAAACSIHWERESLKVPFLWGKPTELADVGACYIPYRDAVEFVEKLIAEHA